ncbi:hypothetical protein HDU76_013518 [Blyttiomyces sp. JEL0837]|nr:hypothetical protein HDU76_013518 [Blyttiomyces sp. JEL0837]
MAKAPRSKRRNAEPSQSTSSHTFSDRAPAQIPSTSCDNLNAIATSSNKEDAMLVNAPQSGSASTGVMRNLRSKKGRNGIE